MANTKKQENKNVVDLSEIKEELTDYINIQIKKNFSIELENAYKRLIREKNKSIIVKNIVIILLLCIVCFLLYLLYNNNYFDKYFNSNEEVIEVNNDEFVEVDKETGNLDELIEEYGYLIDNVVINEKSIYINDYYSGNLTDELKNYLVLNTMNFDELFVENDYNIIDNSDFNKYYNKLFKEEYESKSFKYNGIEVRYIKKLESYITDSIIVKEESNIKKEITNIDVSEDGVTITTVEGLVKDNKLYNILDDKEITNYKNDSLTNYDGDLNKMIYIFHDGKLVNIKC